MKLLNKYFFGDDSVSLSDGLWFYGIIGLLTVFGISLMIFDAITLVKVGN